jgi:hypothetical protein
VTWCCLAVIYVLWSYRDLVLLCDPFPLVNPAVTGCHILIIPLPPFLGSMRKQIIEAAQRKQREELGLPPDPQDLPPTIAVAAPKATPKVPELDERVPS